MKINETLDRVVTEQFKKRGEMMPMLFADSTDGKRLVIAVPELGHPDYETKQKARRAVKLILATEKITEYVLACEAWIAEHKLRPDGTMPDLDDCVRPSEDANRIEALIVGFIGKEGKAMRIYKIVRTGEKKDLELYKEAMDSIEGPLTELL